MPALLLLLLEVFVGELAPAAEEEMTPPRLSDSPISDYIHDRNTSASLFFFLIMSKSILVAVHDSDVPHVPCLGTE